MYSRLDQHAEKGKEDGLYISCVASSRNLWAVIMDAGTAGVDFGAVGQELHYFICWCIQWQCIGGLCPRGKLEGGFVFSFSFIIGAREKENPSNQLTHEVIF
ncbi:hypothetical protein ACSBR2_040934 [Camellia fascicularis]